MGTENTTGVGIAARLRAAREHAGLSQGQVARMLDYHRPTISEIEAGRRTVTAEEITIFARTYSVSPSWLLSGRPEVENPAIELAARELSKLKHEDLGMILDLLKTLRKNPGKGVL